MDKVQIKKMVAQQIKVIEKTGNDMAISRWERARALYQIHSMIIWDKSPYKTFREFVTQELIDINSASALLWVVNYNQMSKWYTWTQIKSMATKISYSRAVIAQQQWGNKRKVSLQQFIKFAKSVKRENRTIKISIPNPNKIYLTLPALYVDKFESILIPHGYILPKDRNDPKHGISDALIKYLDTV